MYIYVKMQQQQQKIVISLENIITFSTSLGKKRIGISVIPTWNSSEKLNFQSLSLQLNVASIIPLQTQWWKQQQLEKKQNMASTRHVLLN